MHRGSLFLVALLILLFILVNSDLVDNIPINARHLLELHSATETYVPVDYFPRGYITGYFFKSDYSCTSFPPQVIFSFAVGVCYANTTTGQNFVLQANGEKKLDQLVVIITTYWDKKCHIPQSQGYLPGYPTLCVDQVYGGENFYGLFKYSGQIPQFQPAPGLDTRYFQTVEACDQNGEGLFDSPDRSLRPYLVSWQFTESCNLLPTKMCATKPYLSFGSMFFATTQCTSISSGNGYTPPRNFMSCFAGSETVRLIVAGQEVISPISNVRVGDRILAATSGGNISLADVIAVPHSLSAMALRAHFVNVVTNEGNSLRVTADHLLVGGECDSSFFSSKKLPLIQAGDVRVGSCLLTEQGLQSVTSVSGIWGNSYYTVVTTEEYIIVNGFIASPFSWSHDVGNAYYGIHRGLYSYYPDLLKHSWIADSINLFPDLLTYP